MVVLGFPLAAVADRAPLPGGVSRVNLKSFDEDHLRKQLTTIAESAGPIGTFTYLHPPFQLPADRFPCFSEAEKDLIKQVFLLAKHLKEPLETAAQIGRSSFLTVVRLDGHLGLGETGNFSPLSGGLSGLTKSLNLEWPSVFCRAIDLDPKHDPEQSACDLLSEFNDPDLQIVEVGIGPAGRSTLVAQDPD